jgi:hypothetical protein
MAKSKGKVKRPSLFQSPQKTKKILKDLGAALTNNTLNGTMEAIIKAQPKDISVQRMPKYLKLTQERLDNLEVIDLKPFFARSAKAKKKKDGGWYMVVPIKLGARKMKSTNRRLYEELRAVDLGGAESRTVVSDYLYDKRRQSEATMLNYTPRSSNVTKIRTGKNRHDYVAYRTVSDKSPMSSWILNRDKVNSDDQSKTFVRNVNRLMKWKMKNM